ncbi:MAG: DUF2029 domain-containing protein [Rhodospirillales bacterium]|nr:DUF2029 domain-containing protein [Rhodospirillales bacterium]
MTARGGMGIEQNWSILARRCWQTLLWAALGFFWLLWFEIFVVHMLPRLGYLTGRQVSIDPPCITPECDFSAFWPAGLLARTRDFSRLYTPSQFLAFQRQAISPHATLDAFFYPPFTLLPSAAISWLPFEDAFFVWTLVFTTLSILLLRKARFTWRVILAGLLCPAALWNLELGQLGVIDGALLIAGLMCTCRNQAFAGGVLGLLACKPQAGIMVPFALLAERSWSTFFYFIAAVSFLGLLTIISFGPDSWLAYEKIGRAYTTYVLQAAFNSHAYTGGGVSIFWMLRSFGASLPVSYFWQLFCTLAAGICCFLVWRQQEVPYLDKVGITVLLSLLATPYAYVNDMSAGSFMLAALAEKRIWRLHTSDVLFWLWPAFCQLTAERTGILFTPLVVMFSTWHIMREAGLFRRVSKSITA